MLRDYGYILIKKGVILFLFVLFISLNLICKSPDDYKPEVDSLLPPPAPPVLLTPPDSFVHMPLGWNKLFISWEAIPDVEFYEINFSGDSTPAWTLKIDTNFLNQNWFNQRDRFIWKVRAYSPQWEYYTDWSTPRFFEVRDTFPPPELIYPPDDTLFIVDTLPADISLQWTEIPEAEFYEFHLYFDTLLLYELNLAVNYYIITVDTTGGYYWEVRANNRHWEFPTRWSSKNCFFVN